MNVVQITPLVAERITSNEKCSENKYLRTAEGKWYIGIRNNFCPCDELWTTKLENAYQEFKALPGVKNSCGA